MQMALLPSRTLCAQVVLWLQVGPVAFEAKGDGDGMTYEMNVRRDAR
jgi:hypothetical protein